MAEYRLSHFFGGITDEPRNETQVSFDVLRHFNIDDDTRLLKPHPSLEADETTDQRVTAFAYNAGILYGVGRNTSNNAKLQIYTKNPELTGSWTAATSGTSSADSTLKGVPAAYKDKLYGVHNSNQVFEYNIGTPGFVDQFGSANLSHTPTYVAQPVIAPDDVLYIPYDHRVAAVEGSTLTPEAFLLPDIYTIRSAEPWSNYLALGASGDGLSERSKVFIWDLINADPIGVVDCGLDMIWQIANINGTLIIICLSSDDSTLNTSQKLVIRAWGGVGNKAPVIYSRDLGGSGFTILEEKFVEGGFVYFCLNKNDNADEQKGIYSFGRKNDKYPFRLVHEIKAINDTLITTINGITKTGQYWWIAHSNDGSIERTNDNDPVSYSATSVFETEIIQGEEEGGVGMKKRLIEIGVTHENLIAGQTVTVKYRKDKDDAYTTLLTSNGTTDSGQQSLYVTRSSSDTTLPADWHEIQFRVESTGGAAIKELFANYKATARKTG